MAFEEGSIGCLLGKAAKVRPGLGLCFDQEPVSGAGEQDLQTGLVQLIVQSVQLKLK